MLLSFLIVAYFLPAEGQLPPGMEEFRDLLEDFYDDTSRGIKVFKENEVMETLTASNKVWLIHFYSSWCAHCRRFQDNFKTMGVEVEMWKDFVGVGVINCAREENLPTCRDYDIIGYPMVKFFPPKATGVGLLDPTVADEYMALSGLVTWLERHQLDPEYKDYFGHIPNVTTLRTDQPSEIWDTHMVDLKSSSHAVLIIQDHELGNFNVGEIILDVYSFTKDLPEKMIVRKMSLMPISFNESSATPIYHFLDDDLIQRRRNLTIGLLNNLKVAKEDYEDSERGLPLIVALKKDQDGSVSHKVLLSYVIERGNDLKLEMKHIIYQYFTNEVSSNHTDPEKLELAFKYPPSKTSIDMDALPDDIKEILALAKQQKILEREIEFNTSLVTDKEKIFKRRYMLHMWDIEKTIQYSLSQEVSKRKYIKGSAIDSLKSFLSVLLEHFPAKDQRHRTLSLLKNLHAWIHEKGKAFTGIEFAITLESMTEEVKAFSKVYKSPYFLGCNGTKEAYGQYPCGLWSLWHTLSVQHYLKGQGHPLDIIRAMITYIDHYFGCRECAENFKDESKDVESQVRTHEDAMLWLWWTHNKVNLRLVKDDSDDPGYPKMVFPSRDFCPECYLSHYNKEKEIDLWSDFDLPRVREFLVELYSRPKMTGLAVEIDKQERSNRLRAERIQTVMNAMEKPIITSDDADVYIFLSLFSFIIFIWLYKKLLTSSLCINLTIKMSKRFAKKKL